jgi:DNA-binding response OmpR family regulator
MKPVILVVDDDIAMGELLRDVLGAHAFEVLVCQSITTGSSGRVRCSC